MKSLDKNFICPHCEHQFYSEWVSIDELGWHVSCPECGGSFDIDVPKGRIIMAITDPPDEEFDSNGNEIDPYLYFTDDLMNTTVHTFCTYDSPEEFLKDWQKRMNDLEENHDFSGVGMWYWVYDGEDLVCSGAMDPNDEEIFRENFPIWDYIKNALFVSVWNDGYVTVKTPCKVHMPDREVFDIEVSDVSIDGILTREYIEIDGETYDVVNIRDTEPVPDQFWYA